MGQMSAPVSTVSDGWQNDEAMMSIANVEYPSNLSVPASPQHPVSPSSIAEVRGRKRQDRRHHPYNKQSGRKKRHRRDNVEEQETDAPEASTSSKTPPTLSINYYKYFNKG